MLPSGLVGSNFFAIRKSTYLVNNPRSVCTACSSVLPQIVQYFYRMMQILLNVVYGICIPYFGLNSAPVCKCHTLNLILVYQVRISSYLKIIGFLMAWPYQTNNQNNPGNKFSLYGMKRGGVWCRDVSESQIKASAQATL